MKGGQQNTPRNVEQPLRNNNLRKFILTGGPHLYIDTIRENQE